MHLHHALRSTCRRRGVVAVVLRSPGGRTFSSDVSSAKRAGGYVLFGGLVAGTAALGTWQTQRYNWKVDKVERRKQELRRPPAPLAHILDDNAAAFEARSGGEGGASAAEAAGDGVREMRRVTVRGTWDHTSSMLIGRRGAPPGLMGAAPQGMAVAPSGYYLCTALVLAASEGPGLEGERVVVNRGWLPAAVADAKAWARPTGPVEVTGLVNMRGGEAKATFSPVNDPASGTMLWVELPVLAKALGCSRGGGGGGGGGGAAKAILIDEVVEAYGQRQQQQQQQQQGSSGSSTAWEWPAARDVAGFEAFPVMPETHAVYATTWFSLSAFGLAAASRLLRAVPK